MDDRQTQIKEGAGLTESRLNEDLLDFLRKYSSPFFVIVIAVSLAWMGYRFYERRLVEQRDAAFAALSTTAESAGTPSPQALRAVSADHASVGSVAALADLRLADLYLEAVRRGLQPGAALKPDGTPENESDVLSDTDRAGYLDDAAALYRGVVDSAGGDLDRSLLAINGMFGLAAVAESRGDLEAARSHYEAAVVAARSSGMVGLDRLAEARISSLETLSSPPGLIPIAELPRLPGEPARPGDVPAEGTGASETPLDGTDSEGAAPVDDAEPALTEPALTEPASTEPASTEPASEPAGETGPPPNLL